jgi:hypothetical protein
MDLREGRRWMELAEGSVSMFTDHLIQDILKRL